MAQKPPTSFRVFVAVLSATAFAFLIAVIFSMLQVDRKYAMILALLLFISFAFTTVGIYAGFKFKTDDIKLRRRNLIGLIGNLVIFLFILYIMAHAALTSGAQ